MRLCGSVRHALEGNGYSPSTISDYGSEGCRFNSYWVRHFLRGEIRCSQKWSSTKTAQSPQKPPNLILWLKNSKKSPAKSSSINTVSKVYYIRIRTETEDTERSSNTTKRTMAVKLRDRWLNNQTNVKLGLEEPKKAPKRLRIDRALADYCRAGFASIRRGELTHDCNRSSRMKQIAQLVPPPLVAKCEFGFIMRVGENVIHVRRAPLSLAPTVSGRYGL